MLMVLFVLGTMMTSFLVLLGHRIPKQQSTGGRSQCDHCGQTIPWYGIVPVLGWFFVRGKCVHCGVEVSFWYPLSELLGGLIFLFGYLLLRDNMVEYSITMVFVMLMITVSVSDLKYQVVPDKVLLFFLPLILVLRMVYPLTTWYYSLLGGVLGFLFMWLMAYYGKKRFKKEALGGGDIKLYFLIGLFLEVHLVFLSLLFASLLGLLFGKLCIKKMTYLPFVPFIFAGVMLAYFLGPMILTWYIGVLI